MQGAYDHVAEEYDRLVQQGSSIIALAASALLDAVGPVAGLWVCDVACGQGVVTRELARRGASATGVDLSARLIELARRYEEQEPLGIAYVVDDAQVLRQIPSGQFHLVTCSLALMDIPDLDAVYRSVRRVLKPGGRFVFTITHPCFQTPGTNVDTDAAGRFVARRVLRYKEEGFWRSEGGKIRTWVGAHHRTLSTYLNRLLAAGFHPRSIAEPTLPPGAYSDPFAQGHVEIPPVLLVDATTE